MELKNFQIMASEEIASRFYKYNEDPLFKTKNEIIPYYQNLSAITGSGKTLILADCLEQIRAYLPVQPIILWLSKGKVVVSQTLDNLSNGKYTENIPNYVVKPLLDCKEIDLLDDKVGLLLIATVGKINQKDMGEGDRRVFQTGLDNADSSLWDMLKRRKTYNDVRRDLIIIYDEGHNLSDQQTKLLLELSPTALIAASATTKVPKELEWVITRLKNDKNLSDKDLIVSVSNQEVVESGLIKKYISIGGYITDMEVAINSLLEDMKQTELAAIQFGCKFFPKAIYVSDTNVLHATSEVDNFLSPFQERKARPIQIWKHLVSKGVNPNDIAVYCNLKFDKKFPKPNNFNLFSGGDNDYVDFIRGNYRHIIFNLSLQEGWDDASCYFAYIDKDMGSSTQVTQIIGRVLRQPNATHYQDDKLNMANFYIKTDEKDVFKEIIEDIKRTLAVDIPEVSITYRVTSGHGKDSPVVQPRVLVELPDIVIISDKAKVEIDDIVNKLMDYRNDKFNTVGVGTTVKVVAEIGKENTNETVMSIAHSNKVTVRWIFRRELEKLAKNAITVCDISAPKFDALVEYNSNAAIYIKGEAQKIADVYRQNSIIAQNPLDTSPVGAVFIENDGCENFTNSVHPKYSGFNKFELAFATELDKQGCYWMRNPQNGLLKIKLLDGKGTDNFNPDFIVWLENEILALDTKGNHLILVDSGRKLFYIDKTNEGKDLTIKLISEKKYNKNNQVVDNNGYTVWTVKQGEICPITCSNLKDAVNICIGN